METNERAKLETLLQSLGTEIVLAQPGSDRGQFPILDLLGNIRDEAAHSRELAPAQAEAAAAWERVVGIVESGQPFDPVQVEWLGHLFQRLEMLIENPGAEVASESTPSPALLGPPAAPPSATEEDEDPPLTFDAESDDELLREFVTESREHLDNIEHGVIVLEEHPQDAATLNTIFRAFHTFKGGAGFLNLVPINRLAHVLESLLDLARQGQLAITPPVIDLILRGRDTLKQFVDEIDARLAGNKPKVPRLISTTVLKAQVRAMLNSPGLATLVPVSPVPTPEKLVSPEFQPGLPELKAALQFPPESERKPLDAPISSAAPDSTQPSARTISTIKVDPQKLDAMMDMVGELVIAQSLVAQNLSQIGKVSPPFARNLAEVGRITKELQRLSLALRMVPVRGVFQKMARVVRDLASKQQKRIQLITEGDDTELDRGMVEDLNDPLLHMIRNSVDHGIEPANARAAQGKPGVGTIRLHAYHQAGNIVIEVSDDGAGLSRDRILAKALQKGIIAPDIQMSDDEVFNLIFAPGFSTAETITDVSGRGVGLDVVRRNVEKLRGCVEVSSISGQSTTMKLMVPLTLAIIDGLVVMVGQERYILPTLSVRESFRPTRDMLFTVQGRGELVKLRGRILPLVRLHERFGIASATVDPTQGLALVVQSGATQKCLLVDHLLNKQEVVIKSLGEMLQHQNPLFAGAAILGDGRVGLILDVNSLTHTPTGALRKAA